jgi:phage N-6-adenine-methyltransferase
MTDIKSKFETTKIDWETPIDLFSKLDKEFNFDIDLAASDKNKKVSTFFSESQDALQQDWTGKTGFLNPPFNSDGFSWEDWIAKAYEASQTAGTTIVALLPARTNVKWWYRICMKAAEIRFIEGRLRFAGAAWPLPQPMAVVVFKKSSKPTVYSSMKP